MHVRPHARRDRTWSCRSEENRTNVAGNSCARAACRRFSSLSWDKRKGFYCMGGRLSLAQHIPVHLALARSYAIDYSKPQPAQGLSARHELRTPRLPP